MSQDETSHKILGNLVSAVKMLEDCPEFALLMPEVRVNIVYALPSAKTPADIAAIDGRITVVAGRVHASGLPAWGASDHMARLIIEARKYNPEINAGMNFKCNQDIIEVVEAFCDEWGLAFGWIDRTKEPAEVMEKDGSSMPWKIKQVATRHKGIPRLFYEGDGWGKEPLFMAVGSDALEVVGMAVEIAKRYRLRMSP